MSEWDKVAEALGLIVLTGLAVSVVTVPLASYVNIEYGTVQAMCVLGIGVITGTVLVLRQIRSKP